MVRGGGEGDVVQKAPSGIALNATIGKYSKRYGCEHKTLTLQCQWCKNWSRVCMFIYLIRLPLVTTIEHGKNSRILGAKHCAFLKDLQKNLFFTFTVVPGCEVSRTVSAGEREAGNSIFQNSQKYHFTFTEA